MSKINTSQTKAARARVLPHKGRLSVAYIALLSFLLDIEPTCAEPVLREIFPEPEADSHKSHEAQVVRNLSLHFWTNAWCACYLQKDKCRRRLVSRKFKPQTPTLRHDSSNNAD